MFEPLGRFKPNDVLDHGVSVLNESLNCRFTGLLQTVGAAHSAWVRQEMFCHFSRQPHCTDLQKMEVVCRSQPHVAAKIIKVKSVSLLAPLLQEGVRIIQQVRDPRGVIVSRRSTAEGVPNVSKMASSYCQGILADLQFFRTTIIPLEEKLSAPNVAVRLYSLLRYEDLVRTPTETIDDVYSFLGIQADGAVRQWAVSLTKHDNKASDGMFGTSRKDPVATSEAWRYKMSWSDVRVIQEACADMMDIFGYRIFATERDLKDSDAVSILPFNKTDVLYYRVIY
jgi:hypothetical protein